MTEKPMLAKYRFATVETIGSKRLALLVVQVKNLAPALLAPPQWLYLHRIGILDYQRLLYHCSMIRVFKVIPKPLSGFRSRFTEEPVHECM